MWYLHTPLPWHLNFQTFIYGVKNLAAKSVLAHNERWGPMTKVCTSVSIDLILLNSRQWKRFNFLYQNKKENCKLFLHTSFTIEWRNGKCTPCCGRSIIIFANYSFLFYICDSLSERQQLSLTFSGLWIEGTKAADSGQHLLLLKAG